MGHVQDIPVSTKMILNDCVIYHMKLHIVSYDLSQKKSKSIIHILSNYEQTNSKPAIVRGAGPETLLKLSTQKGQHRVHSRIGFQVANPNTISTFIINV